MQNANATITQVFGEFGEIQLYFALSDLYVNLSILSSAKIVNNNIMVESLK